MLFVVAVLLSAGSKAIAKDNWKLELRKQVGNDQDGFQSVREEAIWNPNQSAIVVVDMWNDHHCKAAAKRVVEMAPHLNKVLSAARSKGVLIIHSPSGCMDTYKGTAARKRAESAPLAKADVKFQWNYFNPDREGALADKLERAGCSCDLDKPCGPDKRVWTSQIATLKIHDEDAVSDNGQEVYNLLEQRGIQNVIVMGVHTNRCVLGRPFGIRQMVYVGKNVVLCRDLTDSYHRDPGAHFAGLGKIVTHVEKYWCATITSASITGQKPFVFADSTSEKR
jgi:nicotinamidase-related amidase